MAWQDIVLSAGAWIFIVALIPQFRDANKPPFLTSAINTIVLAAFDAAYTSLGLWRGIVMLSPHRLLGRVGVSALSV